MKQIVLTILFIGLLQISFAQNKFQYAIIESTERQGLLISLDGKEKQTIEIDKDELKSIGLHNHLILQIKKMEDEGWELFDTHVLAQTYNGNYMGAYWIYILRKKRDE